jgi:hypothetical protein
MDSGDDEGAAGWWLGGLRGPARSMMFRLLRRTLETEDGRRILAESLRGQLAGRPQLPLPPGARTEHPYPEIGTPREVGDPARPPVFVTARFRSGSTLLWNLFRQVPDCTSYYEPLNERRWFDASARGDRIDRTHLGVSDYWREYEGLERLGAFYRPSWIDRQLYMDAEAWDPNLKAYIETLISASRGQPVLQFNRVDFRLPWLRRVFPQARVIHLFRHPRDQWCSSLVDLRGFPREAGIREFAAHDHFYLLAWATDLRYQFPFLDPERGEHPYRLFYWIWKLSYLFGRSYADASFCFEELVTDPRREIDRLMRAAAVERFDSGVLEAVIAAQKPGKWAQYAEDAWYKDHEAYCETMLEEFLPPTSAG